MSLFNYGDFTLRSGKKSSFKIDCDVLATVDLEALAAKFSETRAWSSVHSVPTGGDRFARMLNHYTQPETDYGPLLVDDVWTTGASVYKRREELGLLFEEITAVVIFMRAEDYPYWVVPVFTLNQRF